MKLTQVKICTSEEFLFYFERKYIIDKYDITIYEWVFWIICLLFLEIFGNFSLLATFIYERFGMDPKKRTVVNQLLSQICFYIIFINLIDVPLIFLKRFNGPLPLFLSAFFKNTISFFGVMISFTMSEIMIIKYLYVWKWSYMSSRDDDFISIFLFTFNFIMSFLFSLQSSILDDGSCVELVYSMAGQLDTTIDSEFCTNSQTV